MGNQVSDQPEYQRMGQGGQSQPPRAQGKINQQRQYRRAQSVNNNANRRRGNNQQQQQVGVEQAVDTLQSMFMLMDREVLRLVLMEQCQGNLDNAVETLLAMQAMSTGQGQPPVSSSISPSQSPAKSQAKRAASPSSKSSSSVSSPRIYGPNESILYDDNMRPINMTDDFLQPPSFYLTTYYGLNAKQINNLQLQVQAQNEVARQLAKRPKKRAGISVDRSIIQQWENLMIKYKFKDEKTMAKLCEVESKSLNHCGSLVRVIFMMKLYDRICNESGSEMNNKCGEIMYEYLSERGFREYSLTQFINDCNHLTQFYKFGGEQLKLILDINERNRIQNMMRSYFGERDVMTDNVIKRIMAKDDNKNKDDAKAQTSESDVYRDIFDKYHRIFYHPLN